MNTLNRNPKLNCVDQLSGDSPKRAGKLFAAGKHQVPLTLVTLLTALVCLLFGTPASHAHESPPGCTGSALGITLFTDIGNVHVGDTIRYSATVFNNIGSSPQIACDTSGILAGIVTPDGLTNMLTLRRTTLLNGESDFYTNVVSYVVRAQDIQPDGTVRATAFDNGDIHQNDTNSRGGGNQGVNTEVNQPCIQLTVQCVGSIGENGAIQFTGTVFNCGNNTLVGVTVTNFVNNGQFTVLFPTNLLRGQTASFTGSWIPANPCLPSTATLVARGADEFSATPRTVTSSANAVCSNVLTPGIKVTKSCPVGPVGPGQLLVYSGTVSNTGNVTLSNIVVLSDQPSANTTVFTVASLAPGTVANFTASYTVPANCSTASTLTANAASVCGVAVTSSASSTCPILTTPQIAVTTICSTNPVAPGGVVTYSGSVQNTGNITLNNIVVLSDRPAANTSIFTVATLAPGAAANFTGSYTVPLDNACSLTVSVIASGKDSCTSAVVSKTAVVTCGITTTPSIAVTLACPTTPVAIGGLITYTGTVRNSGNITLNNVTVVNPQAVPNTVLTVPSLAPGASANFSASFTTLADVCSVTSTVTASGSDACTSASVSNTASATCPVGTAPRIVVTQNCPTIPVGLGGVLTYTGSVQNTGNVTLTNVVVVNDRSGPAPAATFPAAPSTSIWIDDELPAGAVASSDGGDSWTWVSSNPAPFSGTRASQSSIGSGTHQHYFTSATATLAVNAGDILVAHVYLDPANVPNEVMLQWNDGTWEHRAYWGANNIKNGIDGATPLYMGPLPAIGQWVRLEVPASSVGLEGRTLTGIAFTLDGGRATWDAAGKSITTVRPPSAAANPTTVFTVATLAPGEVANFTGSYTVPANFGCSITSTLTASGSDKCVGTRVTANVTSTCPLLTTPAIKVHQICPTTATAQGGTLTYTGFVQNTGNITLSNVVVFNDRTGTAPIFTAATLAPGVVANFTGSYTVPFNCCTASSTVTASGKDICTGATVTDSDTGICPVLTAPKIVVTKVCPTKTLEPGDLLKYSGTVSNAGNITLVNVTVSNSLSAAVLLGPITLAPGESLEYFASYVVAPDFCGTDIVTARGLDDCTKIAVVHSVTTTCPITTTPRIALTQNCPPSPTPRGGLHTFTGTVSNPGNVTLIDVFVVNNQPAPNTAVLGPITLAPGASVNFTGSYTAPAACCEILNTLSARGHDRCAGTTVTTTSSAICPLLSTPLIAVTRVCPAETVPVGGVFVFKGTVSNTGDVYLTNVLVLSSHPSSVLTWQAGRAGGGVSLASINSGNNESRLQSTLSDWRTCQGPNLGLASTSLAGNNTPVLGPINLAPGESKAFSGSYTVTSGSNPSTDTVTASGMDICLSRTVTATANCSGAVVQSLHPLISSLALAGGMVKVTWTAVPGVTYRVQRKANSQDPQWIDITGHVIATGNTASKDDAVGSDKTRYYRIMVIENQ